MTQTYKPKLIEVALPLAAINKAAGAEGSVGQRPHPKNVHRWWARRPLAAARAVLFASLVDDPSADPGLSASEIGEERDRLFALLERLVSWNSTDDPSVLDEARKEIERCFDGDVPSVLDPFGGGGAIPLEAQRLGLATHSGDLNPVAVLIQKAMLEVPLRFASKSAVYPGSSDSLTTWVRAQGLAADIEGYGLRLQQRVAERIGKHFPGAIDAGGSAQTSVVWIWARTIASPDPAWDGHVPLVSSWTLAKKRGKQTVWVEPLIDAESKEIAYEVRVGGEPSRERTVNRGHGVCIATGATISGDYIKAESLAGRLGQQLMAVVTDGVDGRGYRSPEASDVAAAAVPEVSWKPEGRNPEKLTGGTVVVYGMDEWWKLFTARQLLALTTFSDELGPIHEEVRRDALAAGYGEEETRLRDGGGGAVAYADAIVTYLSFAIDKLADFNNSLCSWNAPNSQLRYLFSRQAIAMTWDFAEVNPFSGGMASWESHLKSVAKAVGGTLGIGLGGEATVVQRDARARVNELPGAVISTDPPYYDNISYADLSDFFFAWLRHNLREVWPDECATLATPKADELIANRHRSGSIDAAEKHFETGMAEFMKALCINQNEQAPATIYYAYKATESREGEIRSTGWDTFLQAVLDAGLQVTATWPLRTERQGRLISIGANALASSIVLVCRRRPVTAPLASTGEFLAALRRELPEAVSVLQSGNIAPVDMAQSTIGPGIGIFSRYARVVEADGRPMTVTVALAHINNVLGEILDGEDAELDPDTRFAVAWYGQNGYASGVSGDADAQARPKNTSIGGIERAGIGQSSGGRFRLRERHELDTDWKPSTDERLTVWEATQYLIAALGRSESEAAALLGQLGGYADRARSLAYVLFKKATDNGWAEEAGSYNGLIAAWPDLKAAASGSSEVQQRLM